MPTPPLLLLFSPRLACRPRKEVALRAGQGLRAGRPSHVARVVLALLAFLLPTRAAEEAALSEKPLDHIADRAVSALGARALAWHPETWKHGESKNFVYHFATSAIAAPLATESEFYYRVISQELDRDTTHWERKGHIFIFESDEQWHEFQKLGGLEPWTGGIHRQGELFLPRHPQKKFKGNALAHELTHLIIFRFFGAGVPLWLNEGLAEYTATRWYSSFWRARGYSTFPRSVAVAPADYIRVPDLAGMAAYPEETKAVIAFYSESERLVRYLSAIDKSHFNDFLQAMSKGARFESALDKSFGAKFFNAEALDHAFKTYAAKDYVETSP